MPIYYTLYSTFFVKPHELEDLIKSYPKSLINCSNFLLIPSPWQFTSTSGSEMVGGRYANSALKMEKMLKKNWWIFLRSVMKLINPLILAITTFSNYYTFYSFLRATVRCNDDGSKERLVNFINSCSIILRWRHDENSLFSNRGNPINWHYGIKRQFLL